MPCKQLSTRLAGSPAHYTILIPVKSKGLISNGFRKLYPEYAGQGNAWDSARIAYKMYKSS